VSPFVEAVLEETMMTTPTGHWTTVVGDSVCETSMYTSKALFLDGHPLADE
jgi:hypothetical protein